MQRKHDWMFIIFMTAMVGVLASIILTYVRYTGHTAFEVGGMMTMTFLVGCGMLKPWRK